MKLKGPKLLASKLQVVLLSYKTSQNSNKVLIFEEIANSLN